MTGGRMKDDLQMISRFEKVALNGLPSNAP